MNFSIDDVYNLAKGKPTKSKIGSRAIPARLNKHEWEQFEIAQKKGFLVVTDKTRWALQNIWVLYSEARGIECKIVKK